MSSLKALLSIGTFTEGAIAIILNSVIVAINGKRVKTGLKWNLPELSQLVMGIVNITMRCSTASQILFSIYWPSSCSSIKELCSTLAFLHQFHMCFSFWLTACLCAYYCTAITNSNHRLFQWIKRTLSSHLPSLLLLSGLGSLLLTFPLAFQFQIIPQQIYSGNSTFIEYALSYNLLWVAITSIFDCFLPFFFIFLSMITTVFSLIRHIRKMKHNQSGYARPKLQAHTSAIRTMLLFLTLSTVFYVSETLLYIEHSFADPTIYIKLLTVTIFPTLEATIIIQANPQLRKIISKWFCRVKSQENGS
ncbi:taste receptor type 2 member 143-like [Rana temporaria]|uniref:taste receptor type 2 member 143-like n=1 Tax=Rana temporaria TaxID=8407 RepID=UPI001AACD6F7|nr:taste receptor type 2 member 143-like [Rana temporaria]